MHRYVAGRPARAAGLRRYVRAVETLEDGAPLALPRALLAWPALLRLAEPYPAAAPGRPLPRRLDIAVALVEATPEGDALFTARRAEGFFRASLAAGVHVLLDAAALLLRPLARLAGLTPETPDARRA